MINTWILHIIIHYWLRVRRTPALDRITPESASPFAAGPNWIANRIMRRPSQKQQQHNLSCLIHLVWNLLYDYAVHKLRIFGLIIIKIPSPEIRITLHICIIIISHLKESMQSIFLKLYDRAFGWPLPFWVGRSLLPALIQMPKTWLSIYFRCRWMPDEVEKESN